MRYGYQPDIKQKQIENDLKDRFTFDQAITFFSWVCDHIENKYFVINA